MTRTEIEQIHVDDLGRLSEIARNFGRSILYKKGNIPTEITTTEHENEQFTAMTLGRLTYPEFIDLDAWLEILRAIHDEHNIAIALNCQKCIGIHTDYKDIYEEINVVIYIFKNRVEVIYADDLVNIRQIISKDDAVYDDSTKTITLGSLTLKLKESGE